MCIPCPEATINASKKRFKPLLTSPAPRYGPNNYNQPSTSQQSKPYVLPAPTRVPALPSTSHAKPINWLMCIPCPDYKKLQSMQVRICVFIVIKSTVLATSVARLKCFP